MKRFRPCYLPRVSFGTWYYMAHLRVNAIAIGITGTPVGSKDHPDRQRTYENPGILAGHIGSPLDVANFVSFLVSDKAQYIYGAILAVDGGLTV